MIISKRILKFNSLHVTSPQSDIYLKLTFAKSLNIECLQSFQKNLKKKAKPFSRVKQIDSKLDNRILILDIQKARKPEKRGQ